MFRTIEYLKFYAGALTHYQLHSPALFALAQGVLEDRRWFYAYRDVEGLRRMMRKSVGKTDPCGACQGRRLFLTACHLQPRKVLQWGTGLGIAALYLYSGARDAEFLGLEPDAEKANVARANLDWLGLAKGAQVLAGDMAENWEKARPSFGAPDLVHFNWPMAESDLARCAELSLAAAHGKTVLVFSQLHRSPNGLSWLAKLRSHPRVAASADFFDVSVFFLDPAFKERQHVGVVPYRLKPWRFY